LKEFGLNLKGKDCFKKSLKKKKKKRRKLTFLPSQPGGPAAHLSPPAAARHPPLLSLFPVDADDWAPPVSLSPFPFLSSSSPRCSADPTPPRSPPRPATSLPSLLTKQAN
jgi:hypothetical protein